MNETKDEPRADTQSKDKRIAELEGALRELLGDLQWLDGEVPEGVVGNCVDDMRTKIAAALAGTGVASDGGEDGE